MFVVVKLIISPRLLSYWDIKTYRMILECVFFRVKIKWTNHWVKIAAVKVKHSFD